MHKMNRKYKPYVYPGPLGVSFRRFTLLERLDIEIEGLASGCLTGLEWFDHSVTTSFVCLGNDYTRAVSVVCHDQYCKIKGVTGLEWLH